MRMIFGDKINMVQSNVIGNSNSKNHISSVYVQDLEQKINYSMLWSVDKSGCYFHGQGSQCNNH